MPKNICLHPRLAVVPVVLLKYMLHDLGLGTHNPFSKPSHVKRVSLAKLLDVPVEKWRWIVDTRESMYHRIDARNDRRKLVLSIGHDEQVN